MQQSIISASFNDAITVNFTNNAWFNATEVAKFFGKQPFEWLRLETTAEYINCLVEIQRRENPAFEQNQLLNVKKGSPDNGGGTWMHPKLAIPFARWLDTKFAVWCDYQIEKILHPAQYGLKELPPSTLTTEMKRHVQDMTSALKHKSGKTHNSIYHDLKTHFKVSSYTEIPIVKYAEVCAYFGEKPIYTMPELIQCDARYLASMEQKLIDLEKAKALPAPVQKFEPIAAGCVVIPINDYDKSKRIEDMISSFIYSLRLNKLI